MTTNLERIRQMTADELAELLGVNCKCCNLYENGICGLGACKDGIKQWLEQESEE